MYRQINAVRIVELLHTANFNVNYYVTLSVLNVM